MIDISFDFRSDARGRDPDTYSPTLNAYHRALWSKELPNGQVMELQSKSAPYVLNWRDFYFTSDTIIVEMRHSKNRKIIEQVYEQVEDFEDYYQHLLRRSYTIGSMIIFPVHANSMNQRRGTNIRRIVCKALIASTSYIQRRLNTILRPLMAYFLFE